MNRAHLIASVLLILCGCTGGESIAARPDVSKSETSKFEAGTPKGPKFETKKIKIGPKEIWVEIADTEERRSFGLMYRTFMPEEKGMLFIFDREQPLRFWMRHTRIPLSIAYITENKKVIDLIDMEPASDLVIEPPTYASSAPAKYALEMNKGWFLKNKIKVGDVINLSP